MLAEAVRSSSLLGSFHAEDGTASVTDEPTRLLDSHELAEAGPPEAVRLPLDLVDPSDSNPRSALLEIDQLADSIADPNIGLLQPVAVRRMGDRYELISGHRRRAAFLLLAEREPFDVRWKSIPAVIRTMDDEQAYLALLGAQLHNRNWQPKEESAALERLAETRTLREVGLLIHKGVPWVSRRLRLYSDTILSPYVQTKRLAPATAEEFLALNDPVAKRQFAEQAVTEQWGQVQARAAVRKLRLSNQVRDLDRQVKVILDVLSLIESSRIPIETFRNLQVLRGRIEALTDLARGGQPKFPSMEKAARIAGINSAAKPRQPKKRRRTMPAPA
jgi:ParB family chromosome partitioning protein